MTKNKIMNIEEILNTQEPLPEHFSDCIATHVANNTKHNYKYNNGFYPYTFIDVRMVVDCGLALQRIHKMATDYERWAKKNNQGRMWTIYKTQEYEILENTLKIPPHPDYMAKAKRISQREEAKKELSAGETLRGII
jgi:hypothetical protein